MTETSNLPRFFIPVDPDSTPGRDAVIALPATEAHHAAHVLRLREGNPVELFDGRGGVAQGSIEYVRKGEVRVRIDAVHQRQERPLPRLHLAFAVPKGRRLDWLLEKATELGAASLEPVRFERSVAGPDDLSGARRERWLGHCIAAAKQARLDFLPDLAPPAALAHFAAMMRPGIYGHVGRGALPVTEAVARLGQVQAISILIGPEGGLTEDERALLDRAGLIAVRLGRTVLRVETASLALLAAVQSLWD